ncbi:hypothetical protein RUND412_005327 [Rhizina undulata]
MCQYTRVMYVCGHSKYTIQHSCDEAFYNPLINKVTCPLMTATGIPRRSAIAVTFREDKKACSVDNCDYNPLEDPFISHKGKTPDNTPKTPGKSRQIFPTPEVLKGQEEKLFSGESPFDNFSLFGSGSSGPASVSSFQFQFSHPGAGTPPVRDAKESPRRMQAGLFAPCSEQPPRLRRRRRDTASNFSMEPGTPSPVRVLRPYSTGAMKDVALRRRAVEGADFHGVGAEQVQRHSPTVVQNALGMMSLGAGNCRDDGMEMLE